MRTGELELEGAVEGTGGGTALYRDTHSHTSHSAIILRLIRSLARIVLRLRGAFER